MEVRARIKKIKEFFSRTTRNYRMMIVRSGGSIFFTNLTSHICCCSVTSDPIYTIYN